jgi:signal transduction histidine kinase
MKAPTIFWTSAVESDRTILEEASESRGAQIIATTIAGLARHVLAAVARGPVVCLVATDREAGQALSLGTDEVLRTGEVTRASLDAAIRRARTRAAVRETPDYRHALLDQDEEAAFAQLGAAFGERLETPLALASVDCNAMSEALNCLIEVDDQFFAWTALVAPSEQLRTLVARRLTAPAAPELRGVMRRLRASIERAESLVRLLRDLTAACSGETAVAVPALVADIVDVMRPVLSPWATIALQTHRGCLAGVTRATVVVAVATVLSGCLDSIRAASRGTGNISVTVFAEEDAIIIEVRDNGVEIPSDLRPDVGQTAFTHAPAPRKGLAGLRDRLRRAGGDLLVDSSAAGSLIRMFLPSAAARDALGSGSFDDAPRSSARDES